MPSAKVSQVVEQGATFIWPFVLSSSAGIRNLTGWTATGSLRSSDQYDSQLLLTFYTSGTMNSAGTFAITASSANTRTLPTGIYSYDVILKQTGAAENIERLIEGKMLISPGVTR